MIHHMSERDTEFMEEAARAVYFETGQRLGMPDDALQYNETALWFYDGDLYVMNSLEAHVRYYTRPDVVAQCMVGDTPVGIFPPFYRVIPVKDIVGKLFPPSNLAATAFKWSVIGKCWGQARSH